MNNNSVEAFKTEFYRNLRQMQRLFYIQNITETTYRTVEEVPNVYRDSWPTFLMLIVLENVILFIQRKSTIRLNDGVTSLSLGLIQECGRLLSRGSEKAAYIYIYKYWRIVDLPWNSPFTWCAALLLVDLAYYWAHRASHEINIFWAQHQVHHSSEEFNVPVGLRQSIFQDWCSFIFYLPMAFFMPPSHLVAHRQFNLVYQVWIHTKTIKSLGPLEHVLNTPAHHRVHHGCNLRCLDKNYGGFLIIWDKLFKTFAQNDEDDEKEDIVYGLVFQQPSFNPLFLQVFYNKHVIEKFLSMKGIINKSLSLIKGPSWVPGSPWTGFKRDKIDVKNRKIFDVNISVFHDIYVALHFFAISSEFYNFSQNEEMSAHFLTMLLYVFFTIASVTTIGMILESHPKALHLETIRCYVLVFFIHYFEDEFEYIVVSSPVRILFYLSASLWSLKYLKIIDDTYYPY